MSPATSSHLIHVRDFLISECCCGSGAMAVYRIQQHNVRNLTGSHGGIGGSSRKKSGINCDEELREYFRTKATLVASGREMRW